MFRCVLVHAARAVGTPLPEGAFPSAAEVLAALDVGAVVDFVVQHIAYPAVRDFILHRLQDQPYSLELEVVVLGSRALLQMSLTCDWMGRNVRVPWFLTNVMPVGLGARDAARVLEDLLPGLLGPAGLSGHTRTLTFVASRLHQQEWRVYQRAPGGSLTCVLQRGLPPPLDLCVRYHADVVNYLVELSGVRLSFPYLGLLLGDIARSLPTDQTDVSLWPGLVQFARGLVQGQHGLVTRCVQAGLLESGLLVGRLVDPTATFWLQEFVHTFQPLEVLGLRLQGVRTFDALMSVVLECLTALGLRLVGPSFTRLGLLDAAQVLYTATGRVQLPTARGADFHQRPVPCLVPSVTRAQALTVFQDQTVMLFLSLAEFYRPLFLSGLGLQVRAVFRPLGEVSAADLAPLVSPTIVDAEAVQLELATLLEREPAVREVHVMGLAHNALVMFPGIHYVQRIFRILPS